MRIDPSLLNQAAQAAVRSVSWMDAVAVVTTPKQQQQQQHPSIALAILRYMVEAGEWSKAIQLYEETNGPLSQCGRSWPGAEALIRCATKVNRLDVALHCASQHQGKWLKSLERLQERWPTVASRVLPVMRGRSINEEEFREYMSLCNSVGAWQASLVCVEPLCGIHPSVFVPTIVNHHSSGLWRAGVDVALRFLVKNRYHTNAAVRMQGIALLRPFFSYLNLAPTQQANENEIDAMTQFVVMQMKLSESFSKPLTFTHGTSWISAFTTLAVSLQLKRLQDVDLKGVCDDSCVPKPPLASKRLCRWIRLHAPSFANDNEDEFRYLSEQCEVQAAEAFSEELTSFVLSSSSGSWQDTLTQYGKLDNDVKRDARALRVLMLALAQSTEVAAISANVVNTYGLWESNTLLNIIEHCPLPAWSAAAHVTQLHLRSQSSTLTDVERLIQTLKKCGHIPFEERTLRIQFFKTKPKLYSAWMQRDDVTWYQAIRYWNVLHSMTTEPKDEDASRHRANADEVLWNLLSKVAREKEINALWKEIQRCHPSPPAGWNKLSLHAIEQILVIDMNSVVTLKSLLLATNTQLDKLPNQVVCQIGNNFVQFFAKFGKDAFLGILAKDIDDEGFVRLVFRSVCRVVASPADDIIHALEHLCTKHPNTLFWFYSEAARVPRFAEWMLQRIIQPEQHGMPPTIVELTFGTIAQCPQLFATLMPTMMTLRKDSLTQDVESVMMLLKDPEQHQQHSDMKTVVGKAFAVSVQHHWWCVAQEILCTYYPLFSRSDVDEFITIAKPCWRTIAQYFTRFFSSHAMDPRPVPSFSSYMFSLESVLLGAPSSNEAERVGHHIVEHMVLNLVPPTPLQPFQEFIANVSSKGSSVVTTDFAIRLYLFVRSFYGGHIHWSDTSVNLLRITQHIIPSTTLQTIVYVALAADYIFSGEPIQSFPVLFPQLIQNAVLDNPKFLQPTSSVDIVQAMLVRSIIHATGDMSLLYWSSVFFRMKGRSLFPYHEPHKVAANHGKALELMESFVTKPQRRSEEECITVLFTAMKKGVHFTRGQLGQIVKRCFKKETGQRCVAAIYAAGYKLTNDEAEHLLTNMNMSWKSAMALFSGLTESDQLVLGKMNALGSYGYGLNHPRWRRPEAKFLNDHIRAMSWSDGLWKYNELVESHPHGDIRVLLNHSIVAGIHNGAPLEYLIQVVIRNSLLRDVDSIDHSTVENLVRHIIRVPLRTFDELTRIVSDRGIFRFAFDPTLQTPSSVAQELKQNENNNNNVNVVHPLDATYVQSHIDAPHIAAIVEKQQPPVAAWLALASSYRHPNIPSASLEKFRPFFSLPMLGRFVPSVMSHDAFNNTLIQGLGGSQWKEALPLTFTRIRCGVLPQSAELLHLLSTKAHLWALALYAVPRFVRTGKPVSGKTVVMDPYLHQTIATHALRNGSNNTASWKLVDDIVKQTNPAQITSHFVETVLTADWSRGIRAFSSLIASGTLPQAVVTCSRMGFHTAVLLAVENMRWPKRHDTLLENAVRTAARAVLPKTHETACSHFFSQTVPNVFKSYLVDEAKQSMAWDRALSMIQGAWYHGYVKANAIEAVNHVLTNSALHSWSIAASLYGQFLHSPLAAETSVEILLRSMLLEPECTWRVVLQHLSSTKQTYTYLCSILRHAPPSMWSQCLQHLTSESTPTTSLHLARELVEWCMDVDNWMNYAAKICERYPSLRSIVDGMVEVRKVEWEKAESVQTNLQNCLSAKNWCGALFILQEAHHTNRAEIIPARTVSDVLRLALHYKNDNVVDIWRTVQYSWPSINHVPSVYPQVYFPALLQRWGPSAIESAFSEAPPTVQWSVNDLCTVAEQLISPKTWLSATSLIAKAFDVTRSRHELLSENLVSVMLRVYDRSNTWLEALEFVTEHTDQLSAPLPTEGTLGALLAVLRRTPEKFFTCVTKAMEVGLRFDNRAVAAVQYVCVLKYGAEWQRYVISLLGEDTASRRLTLFSDLEIGCEHERLLDEIHIAKTWESALAAATATRNTVGSLRFSIYETLLQRCTMNLWADEVILNVYEAMVQDGWHGTFVNANVEGWFASVVTSITRSVPSSELWSWALKVVSRVKTAAAAPSSQNLPLVNVLNSVCGLVRIAFEATGRPELQTAALSLVPSIVSHRRSLQAILAVISSSTQHWETSLRLFYENGASAFTENIGGENAFVDMLSTLYRIGMWEECMRFYGMIPHRHRTPPMHQYLYYVCEIATSYSTTSNSLDLYEHIREEPRDPELTTYCSVISACHRAVPKKWKQALTMYNVMRTELTDRVPIEATVSVLQALHEHWEIALQFCAQHALVLDAACVVQILAATPPPSWESSVSLLKHCLSDGTDENVGGWCCDDNMHVIHQLHLNCCSSQSEMLIPVLGELVKNALNRRKGQEPHIVDALRPYAERKASRKESKI
eukprot:PhF_6_TR25470/c0_g1_i2/m.35359